MTRQKIFLVVAVMCVLAGWVYAQETQTKIGSTNKFAQLLTAKLGEKPFRLSGWPGVYTLKEVGDDYISYSENEKPDILYFSPIGEIRELTLYRDKNQYALSLNVDVAAGVRTQLDKIAVDLKAISRAFDGSKNFEFEFVTRNRGENTTGTGSLKMSER